MNFGHSLVRHSIRPRAQSTAASAVPEAAEAATLPILPLFCQIHGCPQPLGFCSRAPRLRNRISSLTRVPPSPGSKAPSPDARSTSPLVSSRLRNLIHTMIIDKQPLPGDETDIPGDAPPSYDALDGVPPTPATRNEKSSSSSSSSPPPPAVSPKSPKSPTSLGSSSGKRNGPAWYNFGPSARAVREVRTTLLGLLRDLVKQNDAGGALGVLESCADACHTYDLSLSSLLQEQSVEGHTPLYWAIINRPAHPPHPRDAGAAETEPGPDLVSALLAHAAPLSDATVDEIRLACLHTSDHTFFQTLRHSPAFSPLTGTEEILLGGSVPVDDVDVEDVKADEGAFVAKFRIPLFQKRMRISGSIRLEFIAKGAFLAASCESHSSSNPALTRSADALS